MGCSINTQKRKVFLVQNSPLFIYPRKIHLQISLNHKEFTEKDFTVTEPSDCYSKPLKTEDFLFQVSLCVLPGLDPHNEILKVCQDSCIVVNDESSMILSLFDGHGKYGELVSGFCTKEVKDLFFLLKDKHVVKGI